MSSGLPLPASLAANPVLARWISFDGPGRTATLRVGKVEIGQGIGTALVQIAAEELGLSPAQVNLVAGHTDQTPDEGWTSASLSVEVSGAAIRLVGAEVRERFALEAARRLGAPAEALAVDDGVFRVPGQSERACSYWDLAPAVDLACCYQGLGMPRARARYRSVGAPLPRRDLHDKLRGRGFIHDLRWPGMLHVRVLRPPRPSCRLLEIDRDRLAAMPGVAAVVVDGSFVAIGAEREYDAVRAQQQGQAHLRWSDGDPLPVAESLERWLRSLPAQPNRVHHAGSDVPADAAAQTLRATYLRPYLAHASIGTCCALARPDGSGFTVVTHSQGVFPLRAALARVLGLAVDAVAVIHRDGAGCYGHNGADDVALEAALAARATGRPVRVAWSRHEELAWAPFGPGMLVDVEATTSPDGRILRWRHAVRSTTHLVRPGWGEGVNLLAASMLEQPFAPAPVADPPLVPHGGGGLRNAVPGYAFGHCEVDHQFSTDTRLRTSALRSLGAHANVFAIESMLDEVAAATGRDPWTLRRDHLGDTRAQATLDAAVALAGWTPDRTGTGDWGWGLACARYKNRGAWFAVVVEVSITHVVRVSRVSAAVDCGLAINPDGVRNQIEGGIVQAISWTLKEQVHWDAAGIRSTDWEHYPILRFDEVPDIQVHLMPGDDAPPLGVGECTMGPVAAAIANAIHHALGVRVREMPLTFERIAAA